MGNELVAIDGVVAMTSTLLGPGRGVWCRVTAATTTSMSTGSAMATMLTRRESRSGAVTTPSPPAIPTGEVLSATRTRARIGMSSSDGEAMNPPPLLASAVGLGGLEVRPSRSGANNVVSGPLKVFAIRLGGLEAGSD